MAIGACCLRLFFFLRRCLWRCRHVAGLRPFAAILFGLAIFLTLSLIAFTYIYPETLSSSWEHRNRTAIIVVNNINKLNEVIKAKLLSNIQTNLTAQSSLFMSGACGNSSSDTFTVNFDIAPRVLNHNRERLRRQLPAWRRVVLMITFLNPTFESLNTLDFLYARFFGRVAYCISVNHMAQWKRATRTYKRTHWLVVFDGFLRSKDDRSYECWAKLQTRLGALTTASPNNIGNAQIRRQIDPFANKNFTSNNHGLLGVLSIMDDVLVNLWNFGVVHRGGGISSLLSKIWSMTNGGLFVPQFDVHAGPFFIGNLRPLTQGFDEIGEANSFQPLRRLATRRLVNATICNRSANRRITNLSTCSATKHVWTHYSRFYEQISSALVDLRRASIIRQTGSASLTSLLESTALFADCWKFLHSRSIFAAGNLSTAGDNVSNSAAAAIIGEMPADVLYVPMSRIDELVQLLTIFRRHSLHAEIAIPTAVTCLVGRTSKKINNKTNVSKLFVPLSDSGMLWNETTRLKPWEFYSPSLPLPFLHPVKFSQLAKDQTLRAFLCQRVFPNFIV